jgi:hypothetical protein
VKPYREILLRETKGAADDPHLRGPLHAREPFRRQGLRIGIGKCRRMDLRTGHRIGAARKK